MSYKIITAVVGPVIPLAEAQIQCKVDVSAGGTSPEDARILRAVAAAREYAEHYTQRSIGVQTLELALDAFPSSGIQLPLGAASITSVKYVDAALVEQPVSNTLYSLDDYSDKHFVIPVDTWPTAARVANAVKVRYVTPTGIPAAGIQAMLLLTAHFYENPSAVVLERGATAIEVPLGANRLLDTFRDWSL